MLALLSESSVRALYQEAADTLARGVRADRTAIFYFEDVDTLSLGAVHGMAPFPMTDCPFSTSVIDEVLAQDRNLIFSNVPKDTDARDNISLQLSGAVSLLCVPFYDETNRPAGVLYADTQGRINAFRRKELLFARDCASWLECCLAGRDNLSKPEPELESKVEASAPTPLPLQGMAKQERAKRGGLPGLVSSERVRAGSLMIFFRSLATLIGAGVTINTALSLLSESSEDPAMGRVSGGLLDIVLKGEPLSAAMERYPQVFSPAVRSTVRLGERTGRFVHVLDVLSTDLEKGQRLKYRLRSALTYPIVLSAICALLLLLGPPYLLQGHLRMLQESGVPLPYFTQAMIGISSVVSHPAFFVFLALSVFGSVTWVRTEKGRANLMTFARRLPGLGGLIQLLDLTLFVRSLSLQLRAGMTAVEALQLSRQVTESPDLREALQESERALRNGSTLVEAFAESEQFSPAFLGFIESGESSGTLDKLVTWLASFYERELDARIASLTTLAEPIILAVMGVVVAVLLVATVKPTLLILQTL